RDALRRPRGIPVSISILNQGEIPGWDHHFCSGDRHLSALAGWGGKLCAPRRAAVWISLHQVRSRHGTAIWGVGALLQRTQFLLPLEASAGRKEVRSLHAAARPQRSIRRTRKLYSTRRRGTQRQRRLKIRMGELEVVILSEAKDICNLHAPAKCVGSSLRSE